MSVTSEARAIRFWPLWIPVAILAAALILTITPSINNGLRFIFMMAGPLLGVFFFLIWLLVASRLAWKERLGILTAMIGLGALAAALADPSARLTVWIYGAPLAIFAVAAGVYAGREWDLPRRFLTVLGGTALAFGLMTLPRLEGFTGGYLPEVDWRWAMSHEDALLAGSDGNDVLTWQGGDRDWPGFRGPQRDGRILDFDGPLDWAASPPREVWRVSVGPAWSSFAHVSGRLFTQEQRGSEEWVSSYDAQTGALIWRYGAESRFYEVVSGAGPRATPTFADGRIFALGGKAILSALDAASGELLWQHDLMADYGAPLPMWGFSSSPLVFENKVVVYAGGNDENGLLAFDAVSGEVVWRLATRGMNFSSAQQIRIDEQDMALFAAAGGLMAVDPNGQILWRYKPEAWEGPPMVQAQQIGPNALIVPLGDGVGVARLEVERAGDRWDVTERWSSRGLKPSFNDFVYHDGYLYGFDQNIFACVHAETGERQWKRGRYGFGQVVLLESSAQLILLAEDGEVILLAADPSEHRELGRLPVLDGKTWNHPIVANGRLIVRNGSEAVSLELMG